MKIKKIWSIVTRLAAKLYKNTPRDESAYYCSATAIVLLQKWKIPFRKLDETQNWRSKSVACGFYKSSYSIYTAVTMMRLGV